MMDFNDANPHWGPLGELIPDGTFAKLRMKIKPGGIDGPNAGDQGIVTASNSSNVKYLACEFEIVAGALAGRRFWENLTIEGGKTDKSGVSIGWNVTKNTLRGMIDSAAELNPDDKSPQTAAKRQAANFAMFQGITFAGRVQIEPSGNDYPDKNKLANCVFVTDERYAAIMRGEDLEPDPINARPRKPKDGDSGAQTGGWQSGSGAPGATQAQDSFGTPTQATATAPTDKGPTPSWM